ncbi:DUF6708 domain-containing protein [Pseudomonas sp. PSKL.D1]|uniref:DUF6708 domain-containing protein n=1 Tax=Pseudomonas sp. PSKL.D1 TaxID=3029060 RepID=UPI002380D88C|nr:DUF6708 domain-containing protein [Pseudomonas sp. PSKL.D1]WDY59980.1 hypothetical protein PVV54_10275 [Pseudomonas sp. PSKL.D1]
MYLIECGLWRIATETAAERKKTDADKSPSEKRADKDFYDSDLSEDVHFNSVSDKAHSRGPVFSFNERYMEMRCGALEEARGMISLMTLGGVLPSILVTGTSGIGWLYQDITTPDTRSIVGVLLALLMTGLSAGIIYLYYTYGLQITRLEMLTSRHLIVRFNRITQQVHLHRPKSCGGIVTFPWHTTGSTAIYPADDHLSVGMRLGLIWHPSKTGLPHLESAMVGKQGQGGSELRDEWEFIRRYMEEGPHAVPRPRLSTHLPSPIQAFSAQFEGLGRFVRNSSWLFKVCLLLLWPAFVIVGTAHWVSLMLCWRPRWPKVIREAGMPGKPVPPVTTLSDYPPEIQARLLANADRWELKPGKRPERKARKARAKATRNEQS